MSLHHLKMGMLEAAQAAGKVLLKYFRGNLVVREKKSAGLVSNADLEAEKTVIRTLQRIDPRMSFLAEESGISASRADSKTRPRGRWIIDPLDGTTNFVHGLPVFCVSIAAEIEGQVVAGVIYQPVLGEMFSAVRGRGAWMNGRKIHVSSTAQIRDSLLTTGFAYTRGRRLKEEIRIFESLSQDARGIRRPGSAALDLAYTACGVFDGFWERNLSPWDVAAGMLMVEEAGGRVTNWDGKPYSLRDPGIIASNGKLHRSILRATKLTRYL